MPLFGPSGGTGGTAFDDESLFQPNSRLARIIVRSGTLVDAIEITHEITGVGTLITFGHHGGFGGSQQVLDLNLNLQPVREHIILVEGRYGEFVDHIKITTSQGRVLSAGGGGGNASYQYEVVPGFEIAGFVGQSGSLLDAVGIVLRAL